MTRILHLEDSSLDADLTRALLARARLDCQIRRVDNRADFVEGLRAGGFDVIFADFQLPDFDGSSALELARVEAPDVPFIFVSGTLGEEVAIEMLKRGATDYVLKHRLDRLAPSVVRALQQSRDRADARRVAEALRQSEEGLKQLADAMPQLVWSCRPDGSCDYWNTPAVAYFGAEGADLLDWRWAERIHPDDRPAVLERWGDSTRTGDDYEGEYRLRRADGAYRWQLVRGRAIRDGGGAVVKWFGSCTDIEDQRRMAEHARRRAAQLQLLAVASTRFNAVRDVDSVLGVVTEEARGLIGAARAVTTLERGDRSHSRGEPAVAPAEARLSAPLIGGDGRAIGRVELEGPSGAAFGEDDAAILVQLAQMASVAVENAWLYQELSENDRRKDEFLAMLAHELRNPLASMSGAVRLGRDDDKAEDDLAWSLDVIARQVRHLSRLIDDLLDVSRINRGKIELRRTRLDAARVLADSLESARWLIEDRGHVLDIAAEGPGPWIDADPVRVEQILTNLLTNAAKYTPPGGRIWLSAAREGDAAVFRVRDDGVGIAAEALPRMFELFAQGERAIARSEGGLGIGLTLARRLAEMHDGVISASSDGPGLGSEFVVAFPAVDPPPPVADRSPPEALPAAPEVSRILVVDDNQDMAVGMTRLLRRLGHDVRLAHDGPAALELARADCPDIILLDIGLPGMDGYQVAQSIRQIYGDASPLLIAISGYGQDSDRLRSRQAGIDHHLVKPVDHDALLALLAGGRGNGS